ncbi:TIR domain-containing protein, partial [Haloferula sp. A504]|uniref:toll/interleukin-1 receptor domain-containing protein n=1 Tax=Haloferula sp. A504 TaxID=3373601 RepID=UPI0031BC0826|nr:toll/interleukin-1 receptor domain-containing protein [Verrucomicrobiaceae bacterium E54]
MAVPDSQAFLCYTCKHEFTPAKVIEPLRIFLSYGHDANEELVRRIKADLEKRGHDVWFDKNDIKFGDDWRREITDGITGSHRVLSFLSKHSTRDPGVCLDEIAIAIGVKGGNIQTILVESETEVKPPASISHIQWLDMHDWKARKESGSGVPPEHPESGHSDSWETWYQAKLAEIIRVVESDESRRFAGEIETLSGHLKPIASDSRISTLLRKGFIGRQWLFDAIENWRNPGTAGLPTGSSESIPNLQSPIPNLHSSTPSRLFWITGDPGVGKSAFAAHLTHFGRDKVIAAQFVEWDKPDHRDARRVVRSLAFQLATRLPDYRKLLLTLPEIAELDRKDPAELFDYLLANPLKTVIGGGRERLLIVIDALDEADGASATGEAGRNPLVEMLARHATRLPDWLGLVVTSRPESAVQTPLQGLNPFVLDTRTEANRADLRDFLRHQLAPQLQHRPDLSRQSDAAADADRLIGQILDKSEGVFLYAERFCDDVQHGHLALDRPDQFPQGLGGIFCQWFQRQFPDLEKFRKEIRPALRAILAAREPLPVEILQRLFHWQDEELRDFTRNLGSLFPVATPPYPRMAHYDAAFPHLYALHYATPETDPKVINAYHKSLADWLTNDEPAGSYFVSSKEGHRSLAELGLKELHQTPRAMSPYLVCNLPQHIATMRDIAQLHDVLNDQWFWEHSPAFYRDDFYGCLAQAMPPEDVLASLAPAFSFFAQRAVAKSPTKLGYTLFPHEPGVIFDGGTPVYGTTDTGTSLEYSIPRGAVEPSREVLYDFVKCCHSTFLSTSAFLRGVPNPTTAGWYRGFWKQSGLQATLDDIERYTSRHHYFGFLECGRYSHHCGCVLTPDDRIE